MPGTKDLIADLIEAINTQNFKFTLGIIKPGPNNQDELEIFTNIRKNPLDELLKVLKEQQKSVKLKDKIKEMDKI